MFTTEHTSCNQLYKLRNHGLWSSQWEILWYLFTGTMQARSCWLVKRQHQQCYCFVDQNSIYSVKSGLRKPSHFLCMMSVWDKYIMPVFYPIVSTLTNIMVKFQLKLWSTCGLINKQKRWILNKIDYKMGVHLKSGYSYIA